MTQTGSKTECALLGLVVNMGRDYEAIRRHHPEQTFRKVYTFNSARKSMSTVTARHRQDRDAFRIFTKGAAEILLNKSVMCPVL